MDGGTWTRMNKINWPANGFSSNNFRRSAEIQIARTGSYQIQINFPLTQEAQQSTRYPLNILKISHITEMT